MRAVLFTTAVFALSLAACVADPPAPASSTSKPGGEQPPPPGGGARGGNIGQANAAAIVPLGKKNFGEAISEKATTPLPSIVKDPSQFTNKTVRTEGMVSAVCQ